MKAKRIPVYGYIMGSGQRLIAVTSSDIEAENVHRKWKALNTAQRIEWVRGMQKVREAA